MMYRLWLQEKKEEKKVVRPRQAQQEPKVLKKSELLEADADEF